MELVDTTEVIGFGKANIEKAEVQRLYEEKKYICTSSCIYRIVFARMQQKFYGLKLFSIGLSARGRYYALTAKEINHILGKKLLQENRY